MSIFELVFLVLFLDHKDLFAANAIFMDLIL